MVDKNEYYTDEKVEKSQPIRRRIRLHQNANSVDIMIDSLYIITIYNDGQIKRWKGVKTTGLNINPEGYPDIQNY